MIRDHASYRNSDLVLGVTSNIDPSRFDISKYEAFLDALCAQREHQKTAIRTVCNFLLGGAYANQAELARKNWEKNEHLRERHPTFARFREALPFPDRLACTVDHATGTGKSYLIYGVARIVLSEGAADQVLVLCPSTTIEAGLTAKFRELSSDLNLTETLPATAAIRVPRVGNANESIVTGMICVENIHATYRATGSSIRDAIAAGRGPKTLVLNDEVHHVYSPDAKDEGLKKWKEFLLDPAGGFRYIVGFSGTCYLGNDYFHDVVARYSLSQAMDQRQVKRIEYVAEDSSGDQDEKFQKVFDNHRLNKQKYAEVRPLTIFVTRDVAHAKSLAEELARFLVRAESTTDAAIRERILVVSSSKEHIGAVRRLQAGEPDAPDSKIEWIISVSMLTEGWDVKNVFQIVPHEKRAFDSKLLIAQVLGRGLRVPKAYQMALPTVVVFNHDAWSASIRHLVEEVLEQERRIPCFPVVKDPDYNFDLDMIDYARAEDVVETSQNEEYDFSMTRVELAAQTKELLRETTYEIALTGEQRVKKTRVVFEMIPVEEAVSDVFNKFKAIDLEDGSSYSRTYTRERIRALIRRSLDHIGYAGDELSKENRQRILSAFGNLNRAGNKSVRYRLAPQAVVTLNTMKRPQDSIGVAMLRKTGTVFYDDNSLGCNVELARVLKEIEESEEFGAKNFQKIANSFHFRTPLSVVLSSSEPERKFIRGLVQPQIAAKVSSWIKSSDMNFYEIEYSYRRGDHTKRGAFNPDFFVRVGTDIVVVEVKDDAELADPSPENKGKFKAAKAHFGALNGLQAAHRYHFCFLTPSSYDVFFAELTQGKHMTFQSDLDVKLME